MLEIELKARVSDLQAVRERLITLQADLEGKVHEHDLYLNAPHRDFAETDEALRIRDTSGKCTVTYKGAKRRNFHLKAREEYNCDVASGKTMGSIFASLGFREVAEVKKWREYYHFRDATICLDQVEGLGEFVEIELSDPDSVDDPAGHVAMLAEELGVTGEPILSSYLELLLSAHPVSGSEER